MKRIYLGPLLMGLVFAGACKPCKQGHYDTIKVGGRQVQDMPITMGSGKRAVTIPQSHWEPAHEESVWTCDEYEK